MLPQLGWKLCLVVVNMFLLIQGITEFLIKFRVHSGNQQQRQRGLTSCLLHVHRVSGLDLLLNETLDSSCLFPYF